MEVLKIELDSLRKENEELRLVLEIMGSKYENLQALLRKNDVTVSPEHRPNKRPWTEEVSVAKASQVLVKINPGDKSLVSDPLLCVLIYCWMFGSDYGHQFIFD